MKDYNRSKIIEAEKALIAFSNAWVHRSFSARELEVMAARTMRTQYFARRTLVPNPTFMWCGCSSQVNGKLNRIDMAHSLAHAATGNLHHDVSFVKMYLDFVQHFLDKNVRNQLKKELVARKVRTKEVSDETREKMRENWIRRNINPEEATESLRGIVADLESM